jgi:hypothetical protein
VCGFFGGVAYFHPPGRCREVTMNGRLPARPGGPPVGGAPPANKGLGGGDMGAP